MHSFIHCITSVVTVVVTAHFQVTEYLTYDSCVYHLVVMVTGDEGDRGRGEGVA